MHIIFDHAANWNIPLMKILKGLKFKVYYLYIESKTEDQKNKIATKLKEKNITPLPIEFEKNISSKSSLSLWALDSDEISYKKNIEMIPDKILKKYCNLFSIHEQNVKKLRLLIQDIIGNQQVFLSARIGMWSNLHSLEKIIFISFKFKSFYTSNVGRNIFKIIIPIDIFNYFIKIIKRNFLLLLKFKSKKQEKQIFNNQNSEELKRKKVAFVVHKGLTYSMLFDKSLYYSNDNNSPLNKYNILHLDYSDFPKPEQDICWICINGIKNHGIKIFFKTLVGSIKTIYLIRSWSTFLAWVLLIQQYNSYMKYCDIIKKFESLKVAVIDYDYLCPKTLILAFGKNNIKTVATQERFMSSFFQSFANVVLDTYYVASEHTANVIKSSKYHDVKNIIPMGQYRSDHISLYKNKTFPKEIFKAKNSGKKILIILGHHSPNHWVESYSNPVLNWSAQIDFLKDCIKLAQNFNDTYIILRYKKLHWSKNKYFENILNKINSIDNIIISNYYEESFYTYKLCAYADLVIAKYTSAADECLSKGIPVLFHEYTHNMQKLYVDVPNYLPTELMCYSFEELLEKSKSLLSDKSNKLKNTISELNKTIYYVKEKGNVKNRIINHLENIK